MVSSFDLYCTTLLIALFNIRLLLDSLIGCQQRLAFLLRNCDRGNLFIKFASVNRRDRPTVALHAEGVLQLARQVGYHLGSVFCRLTHLLGAVQLMHPGSFATSQRCFCLMR